MKTIIVYESKHGFTEKCAKLVADKLEGTVELCSLKEKGMPKLEAYDKVIIGASIYAGQMPKKIKQFCMSEESELLKKDLGLFICGMADGDEAKAELSSAYPPNLSSHAQYLGFFGGGFYMNRLNFFEKLIMKMVQKSKGAIPFEKGPEGDFIEKLRIDEIAALADRLNAK